MAETRGVGKPLGGPGFELVDRTHQTIARRGMFEPGDAVVVAVSGGPDSMCLIDVLARLKQKLSLRLLVAHVDHGLSDESERVAAHVAGYASALGYDVHVARAQDLAGPNLHERAREFRYSFFHGLAEREGARRIATGHTLDDRVETTLARLIHGAGPSGLAGIPVVDGARVRPLAASRRAETRAYCVECGIDFFDDPANEDPRFERARIRRDVVPVIEAHFGEGATRAIAAAADRLAEDAQALGALAETFARELVTVEGGETSISREALSALPRALRRRVLETAVGRIRDRSGGIDAVLEALDAGPVEQSKGFSVAGGLTIEVGRERLVVRRA